MEDNIIIIIKEYLGDERYINMPLTLYSKESITPWGTNDFRWEGDYKGEKIKVTLKRGDSEYFAKIEKPEKYNIADQIRLEIKRIIRKLN